MVISVLFFTSSYILFVFQLVVTNWCLIFFSFFLYIFFLLFITLYCFFFFLLFHLSLSLSLSPHWQPIIFKIWWWFYDIKFALLVFYSNLVFLNWHLFYIPFFLWCIRCENECFPSITPLYEDKFIYWL